MENNKRRKVKVSVSTRTTISIGGKYSSEGQNRRIFIASTKQYTIEIILSLEFSSGVWNNLLMADI
jgi:hypothetical protein